MKFVDPNAEIIDIRDPLERIERIGRICYKSEDKIGPGTAKKFVKMLIQRKHYAMLEHAHVHYKVESESLDILLNIPGVIVSKLAGSNWLVTVSVSHLFNPKYESICLIWQMYVLFYNEYLAEDGDIPTSIEFDDVQLLSDKLLKAHKHKHGLVSICFTCDRGVSHELVRHRCAVAQESTRYVASSSVIPLRERGFTTEEEIVSAYNDGFSMKAISDNSQYTEWEVRKILLAHNAVIRKHGNKGCRDDSYFDVIDSPEKAYLLGIIQTDGSIDASGTFSITQHQDYIWYLECMLHECSDYLCRYPDGSCYQIMIGSKHMVDTLMSYGIVPNKSHDQTAADVERLWQVVPDEYKCDFIRGLIDGDGSVKYEVQPKGKIMSPRITLYSANRRLLELIQQHIQVQFSYMCSLYDRSEDSGYELGIWDRAKSIEIGEYLFSHFQYPFGHPKKSSNWISQLNKLFPVACYGDSKFSCILPSTWSDWSPASKFLFCRTVYESESAYRQLRLSGLAPQQARAVLPNALKTEVVLSMTPDRWEHFFDLRSRGTTGAPHPDMKVVADIALEKYNKFLNK